MSADELLPLPEHLADAIGDYFERKPGATAEAICLIVYDYARANVAGFAAEIGVQREQNRLGAARELALIERAERVEAELAAARATITELGQTAERLGAERNAAREDAARLREALEIIASLSMSQFHKPQDLGNAAIKLAASAMQEQK